MSTTTSLVTAQRLRNSLEAALRSLCGGAGAGLAHRPEGALEATLYQRDWRVGTRRFSAAVIEQELTRESGDVADTERAVTAQGMSRAAELLTGRIHPHHHQRALSRSRQAGRKAARSLLLTLQYPAAEAKADSGHRCSWSECLRWLCGEGGIASLVLPRRIGCPSPAIANSGRSC